MESAPRAVWFNLWVGGGGMRVCPFRRGGEACHLDHHHHPSVVCRRRVTAGRRARFANYRSLTSIARRIAPAHFLAPSSRSRRSQRPPLPAATVPLGGRRHRRCHRRCLAPLRLTLRQQHGLEARMARTATQRRSDAATQRRSGWVRAISQISLRKFTEISSGRRPAE